MDTLTPVLSDNWDADRSWTLDSYASRGGYGALDVAFGMEPAAVVEMVKESGLRGRGGAGFPARSESTSSRADSMVWLS